MSLGPAQLSISNANRLQTLIMGTKNNPNSNTSLTGQILADNPDAFKGVIYATGIGMSEPSIFAAPYISQALVLMYNRAKVTDEQAHKLIQKYSKCKNVADFQALDIKTRDKCLKKLRDSGLSIRQISRLTGISFNIVRKF
jgi:hypothetical protein